MTDEEVSNAAEQVKRLERCYWPGVNNTTVLNLPNRNNDHKRHNKVTDLYV